MGYISPTSILKGESKRGEAPFNPFTKHPQNKGRKLPPEFSIPLNISSECMIM